MENDNFFARDTDFTNEALAMMFDNRKKALRSFLPPKHPATKSKAIIANL